MIDAEKLPIGTVVFNGINVRLKINRNKWIIIGTVDLYLNNICADAWIRILEYDIAPKEISDLVLYGERR